MSEEEKNELYINEQAKSLSEITEIPVEEILGDLNNKVVEGFSPRGSVMKWKSEHKRELGVGESRDLTIRVIGKGTPRDGSYGQYAYMEFLVQDNGLLENKSCSFSSGSLPKMDLLRVNGTYEIRAYEKLDGSLNRLRAVTEISDDKVPRVDQLSAYEYPFPNLGDLKDCVGTTKLLHGWVGELKRSRQTGEIVGFEFGDDSTLIAPIAWVGYSHEEVQAVVAELVDGDEVYVCGYINEGERGISVNAKGVFKVE